MILMLIFFIFFVFFFFYCYFFFFFFFFFSSRRRHTRLTCDWSSDVCSSDLELIVRLVFVQSANDVIAIPPGERLLAVALVAEIGRAVRVGKECRSRWSPYH